MAICFVPHARERLRQRKISEQEAIETILHPDTEYPDKDIKGRIVAVKTLHGRKLKMVYVKRDGDIIVITVIVLGLVRPK